MATRSTPSDTTSYAWDTNADVPNLATETDVQGNKAASSTYTYAQGPLGLITSSGSYSFHTDALGSIVEVSDSSGKSSQSYRYDPFGGAYAPGNSSQAASNLSNSLQYAGQYLDEDSDLYYMRAREYDPETARFLETDPVSCEEGGACGSVYVYVDDRPTVETDPSGECPIENATPTCMKDWWKTPPALQTRTLRKRIVNAAWFGVRHEAAIHYADYPVTSGRRMEGVLHHLKPPRFPHWEDCSSFVTWLYYVAGARDPNGFNYSYSTAGVSKATGQPAYTGTLATHGHSLRSGNNTLATAIRHAQPGDFIFFGSGDYDHVEVYIGNNQAISHGEESGPEVRRNISGSGFSEIRSYFPEMLP